VESKRARQGGGYYRCTWWMVGAAQKRGHEVLTGAPSSTTLSAGQEDLDGGSVSMGSLSRGMAQDRVRCVGPWPAQLEAARERMYNR
jgi:hypothetical protein